MRKDLTFEEFMTIFDAYDRYRTAATSAAPAPSLPPVSNTAITGIPAAVTGQPVPPPIQTNPSAEISLEIVNQLNKRLDALERVQQPTMPGVAPETVDDVIAKLF